MNVLIATYLATNSPSGVVTYTQALTRDLTANGVGVQVIDAGGTPTVWRWFLGVLKRIMRPMGGAFHVGYDEFAYFTGIYLAVRRMKSVKFDIIHAQDPRSGIAAWLALGKKVPVVLTCHFNDDPVTELAVAFALKPAFIELLSRWYRYLFTSINDYVFVSHYAYEKSKHLLPVTLRKRILHNTVRLDVTRQPRHLSAHMVISNVGYIDERKNQQLLLEIGRELCHRSITNFSIWLIGDGPKRADYEALVHQWQLTEHVTFYGRQKAPWQLVAQSDLYVHTALNDNCPYSIIEAFAVGVPVLAFPAGGIPEMVPDTLGLFTKSDVAGLTDELIYYFDPAHRRYLTNKQRAYADKAFDHEANLNHLILFYQQIIGTQKLSTSACLLPVL